MNPDPDPDPDPDPLESLIGNLHLILLRQIKRQISNELYLDIYKQIGWGLCVRLTIELGSQIELEFTEEIENE